MAQLASPPHNKIVLKGDFGQHEEGRCNAEVYPGMNVVMTADFSEQKRDVYTPGGTDYVGTGTGVTTTKAPIKVVKEDYLQGKTVDQSYAANSNILFYIPKSGDVIQVRALSGETITKGTGLSANSSGKWVVDATNAAVETLEASNGALSEDTLVRVRVM